MGLSIKTTFSLGNDDSEDTIINKYFLSYGGCNHEGGGCIIHANSMDEAIFKWENKYKIEITYKQVFFCYCTEISEEIF